MDTTVDPKFYRLSKFEKNSCELQNGRTKHAKNHRQQKRCHHPSRLSYPCAIRADNVTWHYYPKVHDDPPNEAGPYYIYNHSIRKAHHKERANRRRQELYAYARNRLTELEQLN